MNRDEKSPNLSGYTLNLILQKALPALLLANPDGALTLLADRLDAALVLELPDSVRQQTSVWRRSVSEVPSYVEVRSVHDVLISQLRSALFVLLPHPESDVFIEKLAQRKSPIYKRIILDALTEHGETMRHKIIEALSDRDIISNRELGPELWKMAEQFLGLLPIYQRELTIVALLDEGRRGPDTVSTYERRDRLYALRDYLDRSRRSELQELIALHGPPTDPASSNWPRAASFGPSSPIPQEAIESHDVPTLVSEINAWDPTQNAVDPFLSPSPEGIGRLLRRRVQSTPAAFLENVPLLTTLEATYIRSIVAGLQDALRENKLVDARKSLELTHWIASRREETYAPIGFLGRDTDWTWARRGAAHFVLDILTSGGSKLELEYRGLLWVIIETFLTDPDPRQDEGQLIGSSSYANLALNSVRGVAMRCAIEYARWVVLATYGNKPPRELNAFQTVTPELHRALEAHLDSAIDDSPAIRAVYGQCFATLMALDQDWTRSHIEAIFGSDPYDEALSRAAWDAMLMFSESNARTIESLEQQFASAISRLVVISSADVPDANDELNPLLKAADEVFRYTMLGDKNVQRFSHLVEAMTAANQPRVLSHLMAFAGHFARSNSETDARERAEFYATRRIQEAERDKDPGRYAQELAKFGSWFLNHGSSDQWLLEKTRQILSLTGRIDDTYSIIETLKGVSTDLTTEALDILELLSKDTSDPWAIMGSQNAIYSVLRSASRARPASLDQIQRVASHMIRRGWREFQDF